MPTSPMVTVPRALERILAVVLSLAGLAASGAARAAGPRIAVLVSPGAEAYRQALAGARRELGGAAAVVELGEDDAEAAPPALEGAAAVVAIGADALRVAERLDRSIAVVSVLAPGVAAERPPRPVYGVEPFAPPADVLRDLAELVPGALPLWTIHSERTPPAVLAQLRDAAAERGRRLVATAVLDAAGAARALRSPPDEVGAFLLLPDPVVRNAAFDEALLRLSFERRFAVVGASRADVKAGALLALLLEPEALGAQAAVLARRILAGPPPPPALVPPAQLSLVVNVAAAERLGLQLPGAVQQRAAEVLGR